MPYHMELDVSLDEADTNSPVRSDEAVEAARKRDGVVEAYELEDNDDGYHCVIIAAHPTPAEREEIEATIEEIREDDRDDIDLLEDESDLEEYLDEVRVKAEAASDALYKELQSLPSIVAGEGRRLSCSLDPDEPVHEIAWSPGHPGGHGHHGDHGAPAAAER